LIGEAPAGTLTVVWLLGRDIEAEDIGHATRLEKGRIEARDNPGMECPAEGAATTPTLAVTRASKIEAIMASTVDIYQ
jgi:hypothetical protein